MCKAGGKYDIWHNDPFWHEEFKLTGSHETIGVKATSAGADFGFSPYIALNRQKDQFLTFQTHKMNNNS